VELTNINEIIELEEYTIDANLKIKKPDMFEKVVMKITHTH
jgi:hypothetical protein